MKEGAWRKILGAALAMALVMVITVGVLPGHAQTPSDYLLGPGDVLSIAVLGEADLTRTVTVRPDGKITLPLLGDQMVAGMTPTQVTEMLTTGLRKYLRNPVVTVTVTQTRVERTFAYLVGPGISRPGTYEIQPGWTLIEVFAAAGGLAPRAAMKRATLTRRGTSQPVALDLERLMVNADASANVVLKDGDIITIPLVDMRVAVLGTVRAPGAYDLADGARLLDAILAAGGPADRAFTEQVGVVRRGADGKLQAQVFNFNKILTAADQTQNPVLQHADIIYVPPDNRVRWTDILSWISGFSLIRSVFGF